MKNVIIAVRASKDALIHIYWMQMMEGVILMPKLEMTNMVMIQDKQTGKVLVQDRVKSWKGLSFPGGHIEDRR